MKKNRVLCSLGVGNHVELLEIAARSFYPYAERFGYDVVLSHELLALDRPASWSKLLLVRRLLDDYETVLWVDADAVIMRHDVDVAALLPDAATLAVVAHATPEGAEFPNAGVFLCRSNRTARRLLADMWASTEFVHHKWWENAALLKLLGYRPNAPVELVHPTEYRSAVHFLPTEWNSLPVLRQPDGRIKHYAGLNHAERYAGMTRDVADLGL